MQTSRPTQTFQSGWLGVEPSETQGCSCGRSKRRALGEEKACKGCWWVAGNCSSWSFGLQCKSSWNNNHNDNNSSLLSAICVPDTCGASPEHLESSRPLCSFYNITALSLENEYESRDIEFQEEMVQHLKKTRLSLDKIWR